MTAIKYLYSLIIFLSLLKAQSLLIPGPMEGEEIIDHFAYSLSYSEKHEQAVWITYVLTNKKLENKKVKRDGFEFVPDPVVKGGSATSEDFKNIKRKGIDRGHLVPAGDMRWSKIAMQESFYYSNISPQYADFNRGIWKDLENKVRDWVEQYKAVQVVTGPVLTATYKHIGPNNVSIPEYFYKVLLIYSEADTTGMGFIMPNQKSDFDIMLYSVTIDSVEAFTGIDFFPSLPDKLEETVESMIIK